MRIETSNRRNKADHIEISKSEYISGKELKKRVHERIDKMVENREQIITEDDFTKGISGQELIEAVCLKIDKFADK